MRTSRQHLLAVCATVLLGLPALAACAPVPTSPPSHTASATGSPVFASDEEALAAAEKAYAAYLSEVDALLARGGGDAIELAKVVSGEALAAETRTAKSYERQGYRSLGTSRFDSLRLQKIDDLADGTSKVHAYVCSDLSGVDVVDGSGLSVVPSDRVDRFSLQVTFETVLTGSTELILVSSELWSGTDFC